MPCRIRSSLLAPNPFSSRSLSALTASDSPPSEVTPSSEQSWNARPGPSAGTLVSSRTPAGTFARSSSSAAKLPLSRT